MSRLSRSTAEIQSADCTGRGYGREVDASDRLSAARDQVSRLERELNVARRELHELEKTNSVAAMRSPDPSAATRPGGVVGVTAASSRQEKVALYRARFAGRHDVYALPWESRRTGKKGWSPAVRGGFYTDAITDADLLPLTDAVIERHLRGDEPDFHAGLYPLGLDERCRLLVCDFDDGGWREDAASYAAACRRAEIDTLAEISRSGNGAHVWIFFDDFVSAASARALGASMLRSAMTDRASMAMSSYDRFFPSQDTLPQRSPGRMRFGNLIALPLQGACRRRGTTVFADPRTWVPHVDQFAALAAVSAVPTDRIAEFASTSGRVAVGPRDSMGARPRRSAIRAQASTISGRAIVVRRDASVHIPTEGLPGVVVAELKHIASVSNPEFYRRQAQRYSTFGIPRVVTCFEQDDDELRVPRGLWEEVTDVLKDAGCTVSTVVESAGSGSIDLTFRGQLRPEQCIAVDALGANDTGVLVAPPGAGKTVIACALIAERALPTAVLVNRADLLQQWRTRLTEFLSITDKQIGQLGNGRRKCKGVVDLIMMQSIAHRNGDPSVLEEYGQIIIDECHAVAAPAVEAALRVVNANCWVGLTATPYRADQMDGLITMQCGPVRHVIEAAPAVARRLAVHETAFETEESGTDGPSMQAIYTELAADATRNALVIAEIVRAATGGMRSLVLTNRVEHVETLGDAVAELTSVPVVRLHGQLAPRVRRETRERVIELDRAQAPFVLIAIDKVAGEGIDLPSLNALFLTMPVSFKGRVIQQVGRVTRGTDRGADAPSVVHDFHDAAVPWLDRMHRRRRRVMLKEGFVLSSESDPDSPV